MVLTATLSASHPPSGWSVHLSSQATTSETLQALTSKAWDETDKSSDSKISSRVSATIAGQIFALTSTLPTSAGSADVRPVLQIPPKTEPPDEPIVSKSTHTSSSTGTGTSWGPGQPGTSFGMGHTTNTRPSQPTSGLSPWTFATGPMTLVHTSSGSWSSLTLSTAANGVIGQGISSSTGCTQPTGDDYENMIGDDIASNIFFSYCSTASKPIFSGPHLSGYSPSSSFLTSTTRTPSLLRASQSHRRTYRIPRVL